mgnify:CR=1 FL=1
MMIGLVHSIVILRLDPVASSSLVINSNPGFFISVSHLSHILKSHTSEVAPNLLKIVETTLKNTSYLSILLFRKTKLVKSINNNYNNWADNYSEDDMSHDNIFYEITHRKIKASSPAICFWNTVPQTSDESLEIDKRRINYGIYNGVTILECLNNNYTLGINITSDNLVDEDVFYSKVILNRIIFMTKQ